MFLWCVTACAIYIYISVYVHIYISIYVCTHLHLATLPLRCQAAFNPLQRYNLLATACVLNRTKRKEEVEQNTI